MRSIVSTISSCSLILFLVLSFCLSILYVCSLQNAHAEHIYCWQIYACIHTHSRSRRTVRSTFCIFVLFLSHCSFSFPLYSVSCPLFLVWFLSPSFCFLLPCPGLSRCFLFLVLSFSVPFLSYSLCLYLFPCPVPFPFLFCFLSCVFFPFCFHVLFFTICFLFLFPLPCPFLLFVYSVKAVAFKVCPFFAIFGCILSSKKSWCLPAVSRFVNIHTLDEHSNW